MINDFWKFYDNMKEPWRMLFAFGVLMLPMWISFLINNRFILLLTIPIVVSRVYYNYKK